MRTIRFACHRHPKDEAESAESVLALDWRLPVKADVGALAFGQPG
jgi:hypothetical protein